jgi:hypothetical protein
MSDIPPPPAAAVVRASDSEREQTVTVLQRHFADGRLAQDELEERVSAAYAAQTRAELRDLAADLPVAEERPPRPTGNYDPRLLIILLCVYPPAGLIYWLLTRPRTGTSRPRAAAAPRLADYRSTPST